MVWLTRVGAGSTYLGDVVAPMLLFGLGLSFTVAPLTSTVLASAPDHQAGIASAINNDVARVAGLLAVAVLPALAGITPAAYADPALLSAGFQRAALIAGILCAAGGVLAFADDPQPAAGGPPPTRSQPLPDRSAAVRNAGAVRCSPTTSGRAEMCSRAPVLRTAHPPAIAEPAIAQNQHCRHTEGGTAWQPEASSVVRTRSGTRGCRRGSTTSAPIGRC